MKVTKLSRSAAFYRDFFRITLCLALCIFSCALPHFSAAAASGKIKINIGILQRKIKIQLNKIELSDEEELEILDALDKINRKLARQREKSSLLEKQLAAQKKLLPELQEKIRKTEEKRNTLQRHMLKRLRAFYMMGKVGALNVTFSKKDLPELMLFTDSFQRLISYDEKTITEYREVLDELERSNISNELETSLLEELIEQAEEEQQILGTLRAEQQLLLDRVKEEKSVYKLAVQKMLKAEQELNNSLIQIKLSEKLYKTQGLLLAKGRLPFPVTGEVLHRFGDIVQTGLKKGESVNGITIAIEPGASVHAVYRGKVVVADYKGGYGNVVIIDHGGNYLTVTSRLDTILVTEGEKVRQNQKIGTSGDIATLYEPGLYFEIRHGSVALDPLEWIETE